MLIKIATTNDTNGNPRRGWLRTNASGAVMGWIEEGYQGRGAIEGYDEGKVLPFTSSRQNISGLRNGEKPFRVVSQRKNYLMLNDLRHKGKSFYQVRSIVRALFWLGLLAFTYLLATHINWTGEGYCWGTMDKCYGLDK